MQRLAALERNGIADGPIKAQYEQVFLDMLYTMCTTPRPDAPEVRATPHKGLPLNTGLTAGPISFHCKAAVASPAT